MIPEAFFQRRWLGAALIVSLAVNAFFIGAAATDVLNTRQHGDRGAKMLRFELRWLAGRLPAEVMSEVADAVAADEAAAERHVERLRELRTGLGELLAAPEPDRAAIDARLVEIRAELDSMVSESQAVTTDALLALPAETRALLGASVDPANQP